MGLLFMDGCDNYAANSDILDRWSTVGATGSPNWTYQAGAGVSGGGALQCEQDDIDLVKRIRPAGTSGEATIRAAFWFKSSTPPPAIDDLFQIWVQDSDLGTSNLKCSINTSGLLTFVTNGAYGNVSPISGATCSSNICDGEFHFIEFYILIANSGALKVLVDGNAELDGVFDTYGTGTISTNVIAFTAPDSDMIIDDPIIWDDNDTGDGFTGELGGVYRIETLRPNANGDSSQFVGSDADSTDNYQLVDEAVLDTADYVGSGTDGNADLYGFGNLSASISSIKTVVVSAHTALDGAGAEGFRLNAKSSNATENGTDRVSESVSYAFYQQAFSLDPLTTAAWTGSGVNAAQFGIEKRST